MIEWHIHPDYADGPAGQAFRAAFGSPAAVFALAGEKITDDQESEVYRVTVAGKRYYVKRYYIGRRAFSRRWFGLRDWLGPRRAVQEWTNLRRFAAWGIPTAILAVYGQERRYGRFVRAAVVTEELRNTADLAQLAHERDPRLQDARWLGQVLPQIAEATRRMHAHRFCHNDLKWRNILVDDGAVDGTGVGSGGGPTAYFIDCPTGMFWWPPFLEYRIVKDLACLDKVAKYTLPRRWRLRFYLDYVGRRRLNAADKKRLQKVLAFFDGRE